MKSKILFLAMILLFATLPQVSSDIYAPSLPSIAYSLTTSINMVQFTMAIYMFGLSFSQLIYGPISEGIGRRPALLSGLTITLIGSFICLFAPNITVLIMGRLIQGCGAGACGTLWRSIFRDTFSGVELAKYGSYLSVLVIFIVPSAPTVGGYLEHYAGWRSVFAFLLAYTSVIMIVLYCYLHETNEHRHLDRLNKGFIQNAFVELLTHRSFMASSIAVSLTYGAFFSWFLVLPVLLIKHLGITPVKFGWIILIGTGLTTFIGSTLNARLVGRFGTTKMLRFGWALGLFSGVILLLGYYWFGVNASAIVSAMILFHLSANFIFSNAFATAFAPFGHIAGYASSLYGTFQIGGGAVTGAIISCLPNQNQIPQAILIITCTVLAWLCYECFGNTK